MSAPHLRHWLRTVVFVAVITAFGIAPDAFARSEAALTAQALAAQRKPITALLLFLNNTELRPGGGFLGTYGLATVRSGAPVEFSTDDVYNLDRFVEGTQRIPPPEPFRRYGITSWWYLRDANWSPDFAESSRMVLDFYRRERGPGNPSVVIGFTPTFAAALLRIVGPVMIDGERYTAENITDALEYRVEVGYHERGIPRPQRKAIIGPLSRTVADRVIRTPLREWGPIITALRSAIAERHLLAYSSDLILQLFFDRLGVAGRVRSLATGDDGLLVVDANLGALKTDPFVERSIRYAIVPNGGDGPDASAGVNPDASAGVNPDASAGVNPDASAGVNPDASIGVKYRGIVQLRYRNTGTFTWKTTRYRTYTRVYLPKGTALISARGAMIRDRSDAAGPVDSGEELGRQWFGAFLSVEPGQERSLAFEFSLAPSVVERIRKGSYQLIAQKQLGSIATPLTVDLEFGTPVGVADPPEKPAERGDNRYSVETDLRKDREFHVNF